MLKDILESFGKEIGENLVQSLPNIGEQKFTDTYVNFVKGRFELVIVICPIDRGPRTDHGGGDDGDDWMDSEQVEMCLDRCLKDKARLIDRVKERFNDELKGMQISDLRTEFDYGEKGHVSMIFRMNVEGRDCFHEGEKFYLDYSGTSSKDGVVLHTPNREKEFVFESEDSALAYLDNM